MEKIKIYIKNLNNIENIIFVLIIIICSIFMFYWINNKEGLHNDEIFSFVSSNYNGNIFSLTTDSFTWISSEEAKGYFTISTNDILKYGQVYMNQARDVHLHYSIF